MRDFLDIRRSRIENPRNGLPDFSIRRTHNLELFCCFIAVAALVTSPFFGTLGAAAFLTSAGILGSFRPDRSVRDLARFLPFLTLPLLAMASTLWSDAPERTLRAALQLMLTMMATIIICRRVSSETLIVMLFLAITGACLLAIPSVPNALARHLPLVGPYGSKNSMAYAAHLLVAVALAVACEPKRSVWWRFAACATIPAALGLMYLAQSAGALLALLITLTVFPSLLLFGRVPPMWRVVIIVLLIVIITLALAFLPELEAAAADFRQNVLKKNATLTGRSYLWDFAYRLASARPVLGYGYYAFWREGNIDAEGLWRYAGIASRSGFNFHNTFVEMRVDLGLVGVITMVATCAAIVCLALARQFTNPSVGLAFLLALTISELVRATAETSLFGPFSYYTLLLLATGIYARSAPLSASETASQTSIVTPRGPERTPRDA